MNKAPRAGRPNVDMNVIVNANVDAGVNVRTQGPQDGRRLTVAS